MGFVDGGNNINVCSNQNVDIGPREQLWSHFQGTCKNGFWAVWETDMFQSVVKGGEEQPDREGFVDELNVRICGWWDLTGSFEFYPVQKS